MSFFSSYVELTSRRDSIVKLPAMQSVLDLLELTKEKILVSRIFSKEANSSRSNSQVTLINAIR